MASSSSRLDFDPTLYDELDYLLKQAAMNPRLPPPAIPAELDQAMPAPARFRRSAQPAVPEPPPPVGNIRIDWDSYAGRPASARPADEPEKKRDKDFSDLIADMGKPLQYRLDDMTEGFARSAHHLGAPELATWLSNAVNRPEGYTPGIDAAFDKHETSGAMNNLMESLPDFAWNALLQFPQTRVIAAPVGAAVSAFEDIGRIIDEREKNNGRPADLTDKTVAAIAAGLGGVASEIVSMADKSPPAQLARHLLPRQLANYFATGAASEAVREFARQIGSTAGTNTGLSIDSEKLTRGGAKGALSARHRN